MGEMDEEGNGEKIYQKELTSRYPLAAVVSRPDQPARRGRKLHPTPVRRRAEELGLVCHVPASASDPEFLDALRAMDGDLYIAMAYYPGETLAERIARGPLPLLGRTISDCPALMR